jgi:site-specific DNA-methyltransferase (adenine-specific)
VKLRGGDALLLIRSIKRDSIDLVIMDMPYELGGSGERVESNGREGWSWDWDQDVGFSWFRSLERVLKPGGSVIAFHKWQRLGDLSKSLESCGLITKDRLTWVKSNPRRLNQGRRYLADVENMVWAVKPGAKWIFNGVHSSVFEHPKPHSFEGRHPCEKPLGLMKNLILQHTNMNGMVLDPFMGCGVSGQAAIFLGRKFTGFELHEIYYLEAERRLSGGVHVR